MEYRREIDGLRAVAVLPVILFHAGFETFKGGYVGVDVFFVISGFLITRILIEDLEHGRYSIARFYERRARRIIPALFVVMIACVPFAWIWMLPSDFAGFSRSIVAVVFFASNFLFWRETGYFSAASELKPLLHTWSLSVEEQFYLAFPVLLYLSRGWERRSIALMLLAVAAASFALCEWTWRNDPTANFYSSLTRAWELLVGSICAFLTVGRSPRSSDALSAIGLALVGIAMLTFDSSTPVPSVYGLVPVAGAALVILFAGSGTWVCRILSSPLPVAVGLISYSAYLWHQPLFALARIRSVAEPGRGLMLSLAVLSLVLAYLTWRFVEMPCRKRSGTAVTSPLLLFGALGVAASLLLAFGLSGHLTKGAPWRLDREIVRLHAAARQDVNPYRATCNYSIDGGRKLPELPDMRCVFGKAPGRSRARAAIVGDSHADAIAYPIIDALVRAGFEVEQLTVTGCNPFRGFVKSGRDCDSANKSIIDYARTAHFDLIILSFRPQPMFLSLFDNGEGGVEKTPYKAVVYDDRYLGVADKASALEKLRVVYQKGIMDWASIGKRIILIYPVPEAGWNVPDVILKKRLYEGSSADLTTSFKKYHERNRAVIEILDDLKGSQISRVRPEIVLCGEASGRCLNSSNGTILYADDDHLSNAGARLLVPQVLEIAARLSHP